MSPFERTWSLRPPQRASLMLAASGRRLIQGMLKLWRFSGLKELLAAITHTWLRNEAYARKSLTHYFLIMFTT